MSFQGDVRGIGLAELLQGLARGRKEGVLTLTAKNGSKANLGLEGGRVVLLPDDHEDPEIWRARVRDAWSEEGDARVDALRMSEIARAERLERVYSLLDGGGVHFRFEPGDLPTAEDTSLERETPLILCDGIQVEFLLLEYARVADELTGAPGALDIPNDLVPCIMDASLSTETPPRLFEHCNGASTVAEIADRLGWPLRQAKLMLWLPFHRQAMRAATPSELLQLALHELSRKNFSRAACRLTGWARNGRPGPVDSTVAEQLSNEWVAGRLVAALKGMARPAVRTLLRRLDHALQNPSASVVHWVEISRLDKLDRIARMKRMIAEFREGSNPDRPSVRELLDLAREFRDAGHPIRTGPLLVVAAHLQPEAVGLRLELGLGLVTAKRYEEGAPWVIAGCRTLLESGQADRAVAPLRSLLRANPRNRDGRQLLSRARRASTHAKRLRKHLLVSLAIVSVFSGLAIVKLHNDKRFKDRLAEVRSLLAEPQLATVKLQQNFPEGDAIEVRALRDEIEDRQRVKEIESRNDWLDRYSEALVECNKGEPVLALQRCIGLEDPPELQLIREPWPLRSDLFGALVQHLAQELDFLGPPIEGSPQQVQREDLLQSQVEDLLRLVEEVESKRDDFTQFTNGLEAVLAGIKQRHETRDELIAERVARETLEAQERLFLHAAAHTKNGDFERALRNYEDILGNDEDGRLSKIIAPLMKDVRTKHEAVQTARRLARSGEHDESFKVLEKTFEKASAFMLPWNVDSYPQGARVELSNGRIYTTPFEIESTFGERINMTFTIDGFEQTRLSVDRPSDVFRYLSRIPERSWAGAGRIDAVPISVDGDHIVADRKGTIARLGAEGDIIWSQEIRDLSGIARAPIFMPDRPGSLLLVTEGGAAWLVASEDGQLEGPHELGSTPRLGPAPHTGQIRARLADGRLAIWRDGTKPVIEEVGAPAAEVSIAEEYRYGSNGGMQVLRSRGTDESVLPSGWGWTIEIQEDVYLVYEEGKRDDGYSIVRSGKWQYIAWEAPTAYAATGRLWISDGAGIRAFVP
ncbi:MAG: DUF4388 domain-containing protein [bacterium]|nr:DUF4388 domain-containing protein [bacterium]